MNTATPPYAFITYTGITMIHKGSSKVKMWMNWLEESAVTETWHVILEKWQCFSSDQIVYGGHLLNELHSWIYISCWKS